MTKQELWNLYLEKNPSFEEKGCTLSAKAIKALFEQTYDMGHKEGLANGKIIGAMRGEDSDGSNWSSDLFKDLFK